MTNRNLETALNFAPPGHFYSPHPDLAQIEADAERLFEKLRVDSLPGIDLNISGQLELLSQFEKFYAELPWSEAGAPPQRYQYRNDFFCYGDAVILYGMMRVFRPRRIIEIGSGFSSAAMLDVIELFLGGDCELVCIEPYAERLRARLRVGGEKNLRIIERNLQDVGVAFFDGLESNDFLFVDSSHVSKIGSDLNRIVFELLPRLSPGVIVHFHDIFFPFEYPKSWILEGRAWNEAYLLRAFLQYNHTFKVLFFNSFMHQVREKEMLASLPLSRQNPGGSLWLCRPPS